MEMEVTYDSYLCPAFTPACGTRSKLTAPHISFSDADCGRATPKYLKPPSFPFFFFFFLIPFVILALLSLSLPVVSQIRGHLAGPPPWYVPSFLSRERFSSIFPR